MTAVRAYNPYNWLIWQGYTFCTFICKDIERERIKDS